MLSLENHDAAVRGSRPEPGHHPAPAAGGGPFWELAGDLLVVCTADGRCIDANPAWERDMGWPPHALRGRRLRDLIHPDDTAAARAAPRSSPDGARVADVESRVRHGDGSYRVLSWSARADGGRWYGVARIVQEDLGLTDRVEREQHLRDARDALRATTDSMGEGMCTVDAEGRLTYLNRAAEELLGWSSAEIMGRSMHEVLHHSHADGTPFPQDECPLQRPRSCGETVRDAHATLFRRDGSQLPVSYVSAPLRAGGARGGAVVVFSDVTARLAEQERLHLRIEELSMVDELRRALVDDRLVLHGQPIVDLATGRTVRQELLLRMVGEDGELIGPCRFLPVAEEHGLVFEIDRWVVHRACALAATGLPVAVNVSARSFGDPRLAGVLAAAVTSTGADPGLILIELTETAFVRDEEAATAFVRLARDLGCQIALDDFGTGYGGFHLLKCLDLHSLKIDVEFVRDIATNPASRRVTEAVVGLARAFGLKTVAEGVEDVHTLGLLAGLGVDHVQGFGLGRPVPLDGAPSLVR